MSAVGRNYAEVLLEVAKGQGAVEQYADLIDAVASAMQTSPEIEATMMSPLVTKAAKAAVVEKALGTTPAPFRAFVASVVKRGRQGSLRNIADEYLALVDLQLGRVRASVTLAREADESLKVLIATELKKALGKDVLATYRVDPAILGGTVVRVGDRVLDGSVRRRLARLKRALTR